VNDKAGKALDYLGRIKRQRKSRVIEIDVHEDKDGLVEVLLRGLGYSVFRRPLPLGDFRWESKLGMVLVERKTPGDARDIKRLSRQVYRLRESRGGGVFPIVLIDHRPEYRRDPSYKPWADEALDNVLLSVGGRVRVAHCLQGQLAHRLHGLYEWSQKSSHRLLDAAV
jgi:ERCC4-type nuclease